MDRQRTRGLALVFLAGVLYSTAGVFTRMLHFDPWTILAWRGVFGALFMIGWLAVRRGRHTLRAFAFGPWQLAMLLPIALGGACYIFALKVTTVADVMVIYATMPFVTAAVSWLWSREVPSGRMMVASAMALSGVLVMMSGGFGSGNRLLGAMLTFAMDIAFAITLVGARRNPGSITALFAAGTVLSALIGFALAPAEHVGLGAMAVFAAFGFLTIGLAMALYMVGARLIPPAEVGLVGIADVVIGPALVWVFFGEQAGASTIIGGAIVLAALVWHLWPELYRAARPARA